jgi:hypothetical protein
MANASRATPQADNARSAGASAGCVIELLRREQRREHEAATGRWIGERLARVLGYAYGGAHADAVEHEGPLFFVPDGTLLLEDARALGITAPSQLLGGVVPHEFVATKSITHPLPADARAVPQGWSATLGAALDEVTLPGFTAFSIEDAARAGREMLDAGLPVRIKPGDGIGGLGQAVAGDRKALDAALAQLGGQRIARVGLVVELNLKPVKTYSIGTFAVGPHRLAYFGMQQLTRSHHGAQVYGGSTLTCVRGQLDALDALLDDEAERRVLRCARRYDAEVALAYPDFFASRRNYDVALGVDPSGMPRCGVLEQSWRIGGATPAEVLALEAMHLDDRRQRVRVSTHEIHDDVDPPLGAEVSYRGHDPVAGAMTKYALVDAQDYPHGR